MKPLLIIFEDGRRHTDIIIYDDTDIKTVVEEIAEMDGKEDIAYTISHNLDDFTEEEISNITVSAYEFFNFHNMLDVIEKMYKLLREKIKDSNDKKSATKDLYTLLIDRLK